LFLVLAVYQCIGMPARAQSPAQIARIGVLAFRGSEQTVQRWEPTADYLSHSNPGYRFQVVPLTLEQMTTAAREGQVDFILTNPGNYIELEARFGVTRIATLKSPKAMAESNVFGAVVFVRSDRSDLKSLPDLRGQRFMAVGRHAFGGFQMAWRKLKAAGIDPFQDFAELRFGGFPQDRIALAVLSREVDAGTVRTGVLEDMIAEGKISPGDLRVLDRVRHPGFRLQTTTELYPEWPFSRLRTTNPALAQDVAISLLRMPITAEAARAGHYAGWTVPLDYQPVHQMFKDLKIGPYKNLGRITPFQIVRQYGIWILLLLVGVLTIVAWTIWIEVLVNRRTRQLSLANRELERQIGERHKAEEIAREREAELARIGRLNLVGEMTSGLAHELNHPLATIINYANGSIRRLKSGTSDSKQLLSVLELVSSQAQKAADIISSLRELVRKGNSERKIACLNALIQDVSLLMEADAHRSGIALKLDLTDRPLPVLVDVVQIEQVILNLARNSMDAMSGGGQEAGLTIKTSQAGDFMQIAVGDTGPGISEDIRDGVFDPFVTTKESGLGLGLSISKTIVEAHGGLLWTHHTGADGTEIRFTIPVATP
jgi:two-component system sensor histidine kinase TtrS